MSPPSVAIETRIEHPGIPGDLFACTVPVPGAPTPHTLYMESDAADYLLQLHAAAQACQQNMQAIQRIVKPE